MFIGSLHTWRRSRPERAGAAAGVVTIKISGFVCVYTLTVHLMRLSGLFQLGKNQTAAALR